MAAILVTVSVIGLTILNRKILEVSLAKQKQKIDRESLKLSNQEEKAREKINLLDLKDTKAKQEKALAEMKITQQQLLQKKKLNAADKLKLEQVNKDIAAQEALIKKTDEDIAQQERKVKAYDTQQLLLEQQDGLLGQLQAGALAVFTVFSAIVGVLKLMAIGIRAAIKLTNKQERATLKAAIASKIKAAWEMAGSAAETPITGWMIAAAILAATLGATLIGAAIGKAVNYSNSSEKAAKDINKLSKEIYELDKKNSSIQNAINSFDDLDSKVVKTSEDLKEMKEILDSAGDSLSEDEKEVYDSLTTDRARREYLETVSENASTELDETREKQRKRIRTLSKGKGAEWRQFLTDTQNGEIVQARDAMYALNNADLQKYLNGLVESKELSEEESTAIRHVTENMLEQVDAAKAAELALNPQKIQKYVNALKTVQSTYTNAEGKQVTSAAAEILDSDSTSIKEKTEAYKELAHAIESLNDRDAAEAFYTAYSD